MELQRINDIWKCKNRTPGWPELGEAEIRFETNDRSEPTTEQFQAIEQLMERSGTIFEQVDQALAANTKAYWVDEMGADEETADSIKGSGGYYGPLRGIRVWQTRTGVTHIGFEFESLLDENEHGVGVLWAKDRVLSVGSAEIIHP